MWQLRFGSPLDAWAVIPAPDEHERRQEWGTAVADAVKAQWEVDEPDRFSDLLARVLEALQSSRPDGTLADLVTWQTPSPLPVRVTFHLVADVGRPDWASLGFEASPYLEGPFGEGVQYSRRVSPEIAQGATSIDSAIVFDRGDLALVVRVHTCLLEAYISAAAAVAQLIDSCVLTDSTGRPFRTGASEYRKIDNADLWSEEGTGIRV